MAYAGDDYVATSVTPEPFVHSLYSSAKIEAHHFARFPALQEAAGVVRPKADAVAAFDSEKTILYMNEVQPETTIEGFPLRAILIAKIADRATPRVIPVSGPKALAALAPSTIVQLHTAGQDAFESMRRLVGDVPSFALEHGSEIEAIPEVVSQLLEDLGRNGSTAR
jgi:hypothetical protein